jgi:hypothetical protein
LTDYLFEYGTTDAYGQDTTLVDGGAGGAVPVSASLLACLFGQFGAEARVSEPTHCELFLLRFT